MVSDITWLATEAKKIHEIFSGYFYLVVTVLMLLGIVIEYFKWPIGAVPNFGTLVGRALIAALLLHAYPEITNTIADITDAMAGKLGDLNNFKLILDRMGDKLGELSWSWVSIKESIITMITVPFALIGGVFMVYFYGINLSVAVAVGFIALFGMAIETAMLMTIYLNEAMNNMVAKHGNSKATLTPAIIREFVIEGSAKRLRPKLMTVSVGLFGLIPILWATGVGNDIMRPITIPLIGGTISSTIYVLLITPVIFEMIKERELKRKGKIELIDVKE